MIGGRCEYNENTGRWRGLNDTGYADAQFLNALGVRHRGGQDAQGRVRGFIDFFLNPWHRNNNFEYSLIDYIDWFNNDKRVLRLLENIRLVREADADWHGGMNANHRKIYNAVYDVENIIRGRANAIRKYGNYYRQGHGIQKKTSRRKSSKNKKPRKSKKSRKPRKSTRKR